MDFEIKSNGMSDGAVCEACGEYTYSLVTIGEIDSPFGYGHDLCERKVCEDWLLEMIAENAEETRLIRRELSDQERYENKGEI